MKKIALEADILFEKEKTGVGWHASNIISTMIQNKNYEFYLNYSCSFNLLKLGKKWEQKIINQYKADNVYFVRASFAKWLLFKLFEKTLKKPYSFLFGGGADVTQFFNYYVPRGVNGKVVTIVHDMAYLACPEFVSDRNVSWLKRVLKDSCSRADHIGVSSAFTKKELMKFLGIESKKISVVYSGINENNVWSETGEKDHEKYLKKWNINRPYILFVGTIEPRKNIQNIIKAFERICSDYTKEFDLVLAGKVGWKTEGIIGCVNNFPYQGKIIMTGYVSEEEKQALYRNATMFVFPSKYEGFGIPPLEAMANGIPVIVSDQASLPEIVGDAAIKVSPDGSDELYEAMRSLLEDDMLRRKNIERGYLQVKKFPWKQVAEKLFQIYSML